MGSYSFSQVPAVQMPRSTFDRTHGHKTTFNVGRLVPFLVDEALPGDTFQVKASLFARLATPIFPIMDNLYLDVHFFAVPNRLVWDNWQKFMGEREPDDVTDYRVPILDMGAETIASESLGDYMGLPIGVNNIEASALFFRAYNLIWNEWFRDQNLQDSVVVPKDDGPDDVTDYILLRRGKRHDYFTSCLPWPQKGPGVELPLGVSAPVTPTVAGAEPTFRLSHEPTEVHPLLYGGSGSTPTNSRDLYTVSSDGTGSGHLEWQTTGLMADLSNATAATINSLREAFQIQRLLERDARGGTRYIELLKSHFGVISPDARLQRPEFLGGGTLNVNINPVTQTSDTTDTSPQGNLAAYGVAGGSNLGFTKSFVEHSIIIGLISARADLTYQQGLNRMWSRRTRYDFYWPALAHLGEQPVLSKEIYCDGSQDDNLVWGYQERWAEYRYHPSRISGLFRSGAAGSLDAWHLAQDFTARPELNETFIRELPPLERALAVPSEPQFLFDSHIRMRCTRPMPMYSVPGLIDHF